MAPGEEEVKKKTKGFSASLLIAMFLLLLLVLVFGAITEEIVLEQESGFDTTVYKAVSSVASPTLTHVMSVFTFFGSRTFLLPAYILLIIVQLIKRRTKESLGIAAVAACGAAVLFLFKNIFKRERPLEPLIAKATSFSYPSGHSFSAFTFSGTIIYLIWGTNLTKSWKWILSIVFFLFAILIAFSRIYLHVHFASDVIAGFCLSLVWLAVSFYLLKKVKWV